MSIFPSGSGCTGAFKKTLGEIRVELPYALDNSDPFVFDTMTARVPTKIIGRTVEYNKNILPAGILDKLAAIGAEMRANAIITKLRQGPDVDHWNECLAPYLQKSATWNQLPWFVGETYVYHRLLEASGYWDPTSPGYDVDIFGPEKRESLELSLVQVQARMAMCMEAEGRWTLPYFTALVHMSLWGNQGDSSLFTVDDIATMGTGGGAGLLCDASEDMWNLVSTTQAAQVHVLTDNAGMELVSDLALAHYLLSAGSAAVASVTLHLKPHPFFVSDATRRDVEHTLAALAAAPDPNQQAVARALRGHVASGRLVLSDCGPVSLLAASPEPFWRMSPQARAALAPATLAVLKGDLMYRKLLGDSQFDSAESFDDVAAYFPCAVAALRTCKSPVAVGLRPGQARALSESAPGWLVEGAFGMVQLARPPPVTRVDSDPARRTLVVCFDPDQALRDCAPLFR